MFFLKNKLDKNLLYHISNNNYKNYRVLIKYKNIKNSIIKKIQSSKGEVIYILDYSCIICAKINARLIDRLSEYPEVQYIEFDEYLFLCGMSVATANNFHHSSKFTLSGKGVGIGVIDSGVYPHVDLISPSNRIIFFKDLINNLSYPYDDNGHGTAVCGVIASNGLSSNNLYKGIATHCNLYCYKAFDSLGKGFASSILFALEELIKNSELYNIKVICLPFEQLHHNNIITDAFNSTFLKALEKNITPVVPSGSTFFNDSSIMGIATLQTCLTVGGMDSSKSLSIYDYSSTGPFNKIIKPNLCAASVNITSLNSDTSYISEKNGLKLYPSKLESSYKTFTGTSLSAAFLCGICALLYEKTPSLSFKDLCAILKLACESHDLPKYIEGEGLINMSKLLL